MDTPCDGVIRTRLPPRTGSLGEHFGDHRLHKMMADKKLTEDVGDLTSPPVQPTLRDKATCAQLQD